MEDDKVMKDDLLKELDDAKNGLLQVKECVTQMKCAYDITRSDMKDCVNELCLKCGQYKRAHEGACDDCRWLKVKEGFR